ncbi:transcriptional regulator, MarR family [Sphingomonas sp. OV641]|uniref:MarR family winged helix-turn-helix transcriptional regulator n=1 Tax=Sphingomonas sp. OV641 TaxID=1881068 RepID=UPI0008B3EA8C|nr:MarR family winged helix-turn-helix transcriptional regulator [Sphingomonas sp. OV641]SEJ87651.1 transcriptional regulator, MarR family [Sphingomonas sp. OV641]
MKSIELMMHLFQRFCWLDERLQAQLHDHGWPDVSRAQSMVMINIVSGITRPSDIARRLGISRQAIHATVAQMIDKGMVTLVPDPDDARHKQLTLTAFGERMRADAQGIMGGLTDQIAGTIGEARFEALLETLASDWGDGPVGASGAASGTASVGGRERAA